MIQPTFFSMLTLALFIVDFELSLAVLYIRKSNAPKYLPKILQLLVLFFSLDWIQFLLPT